MFIEFSIVSSTFPINNQFKMLEYLKFYGFKNEMKFKRINLIKQVAGNLKKRITNVIYKKEIQK